MAKSFKRFRVSYDDEWEDGNDDSRRKDKKKKKIRQQRRHKAKEKFSTFIEMNKRK